MRERGLFASGCGIGCGGVLIIVVGSGVVDVSMSSIIVSSPAGKLTPSLFCCSGDNGFGIHVDDNDDAAAPGPGGGAGGSDG